MEIPTVQNVAVAYRLASAGTRILGGAIDALVVGFGFFLLYIVLILLSGWEWASVAFLFGIIVVYVLYYALLDVWNNGQTLGRWVTGTRVLRIDGRPLSSSDALVRALLLLVDGAFSLGCIGFLAIQGNARGQRLGDIAAHTVVVYVGKSTVTLSDVLGIVTQEHYTVTYPQVRQLRESDLLVVKQVLYRRRRYLNAAHHLVAERLAERLAEVLNLPKSETKDTYLFLEAILRDYVVLTR